LDHFKPEDVVVVLFHDSGSRYVGKMFNDDWMRERGFLEEEITKAEDVIKIISTINRGSYRRVSLQECMRKKISQIPVIDINGFVGSVDESDLFQSYVADKDVADKPIKEVMGKPFPIVKHGTPIEEVSKLFTKENEAVWWN
jgi:cystathionine beta-synthase